ncbi:hypothetical protein B4113_3696 [Geobacillus sp. B4113_201601]|nr:hypothetical protein B4113_3696 [Geobacillus sp. B4113_201601]
MAHLERTCYNKIGLSAADRRTSFHVYITNKGGTGHGIRK